ncbi:N-acetyltransferase ESCO1 [Pseudophryne corroboree]|uniref:N-acetyltransferase ESCO1 n=1 Tax=Pseudophryne corroboree TaxID=495146 RepID=UPI003081CE25
MTSQKRKCSLPGTTAKRQKLKEESECPPVTSRTRNCVINKSKSIQCSTQKKKNTKVSANKAIKKLQSAQLETGRKKNVNLNVTKKSAVKNVPAKDKVLRVAKDLTALKINTQKSPNNPSKAHKTIQSRVYKTEARGTSVQDRKTKVIKKTSRCPSVKQVKNECVKKKNGLTKTPNKRVLKLVQVKEETKKIGKTTQSKASKGDKQRKVKEQSKRGVSRNKQTSANVKKRASIVKAADKKTKLDCKKESGEPLPTALKLSGSRRVGDKQAKQLQQQTVISSLSKKKPNNKTKAEGAQIVSKKPVLRTRLNKDGTKVTRVTSPKNVAQAERTTQSGKISSGKLKREIAVKDKSEPCSSSNVLLNKKIKGNNKAKAVLSTLPLKRKRDRIKPVVKGASNKVKKQKATKAADDKNKQVTPTEDDQKSKRISILELCNEIAGEIESDTVEVAKEIPCVPNALTVDKLAENQEHSPMEVLPPPPAEESLVNQSKRFFPSRKPHMKCKLEQKASPGVKNSKWNKIKLKNNFTQNNVLRTQAVLPNLEMIKAKVSQVQQSVTGLNTPKSSNKSDATLKTHIKLNKTILSERVKNHALQAMEHKKLLEKPSTENGLLENHIKHELEIALDEGFRLHLDSSPENSPIKKPSACSSSPEFKPSETQCSDCKQLTEQMAASAERGNTEDDNSAAAKSNPPSSDLSIQKDIRKLKEADKDSNSQPIIDAGQKRFGAISCNLCGMLYTASNPEDETQHMLFHNQFISAVRYVGWKKERIVAEYPDGKIIMVLPDDPKYSLKKVEEIREMVDNDLGFQQVPLRLHSRTKTLLFISSDKKVVGCLIAEHIQWGYRVIDDIIPSGSSDKDQLLSERVKAWCCSTSPEPAICGVSRIWVFSMMRRKKIASRMLECLRNHFIYGSHLNKDEIAFSDPTPDGKLFAAHYCGTSQFLVYNFVSGQQGR